MPFPSLHVLQPRWAHHVVPVATALATCATPRPACVWQVIHFFSYVFQPGCLCLLLSSELLASSLTYCFCCSSRYHVVFICAFTGTKCFATSCHHKTSSVPTTGLTGVPTYPTLQVLWATQCNNIIRVEHCML